MTSALGRRAIRLDITMDELVWNTNARVIQRLRPQLWARLPKVPSCGQPNDDAFMLSSAVSPPPGRSRPFDKYQIVYGIGTGQWLKAHFYEQAEAIYRFIVVDPSPEALAYAFGHTDCTALLAHQQVEWIAGETLTGLEKLLREDTAAIGSWGIKLYINQTSRQAHLEHFQAFEAKTQTLAALAYGNTQVQIQSGAAMQRNIIANVPAVRSSIPYEALYQQFTQHPAVIIGAGPSLDRNQHHLHQAPRGTLLIAVDTALGPMRRQGITPHVVVTCDPTQANFKHFQHHPSLGDALLAFFPESYCGILQKFHHHPYKLCLNDWQSKTLQALSAGLPGQLRFPRGMNVGFCAFSLARELGCTPIVLVGMDLALPDSGLSHAQGSANAVDVAPQAQESSLSWPQVPGYFGEPVWTYPHFLPILQRFHEEIAKTQAPVIDATEGGARKEGSVQKPLHQALNKLTASLPPPGFERFRTPTALPPLNGEINQLLNGLAKARRQLRNGLHRLHVLKTQPKTHFTASIEQELRSFDEHWCHLLEAPELDSAMDIALAYWRFAYRRTQPPEGTPAEQAWQQLERFETWIKGLLQEIDAEIALYLKVRSLYNNSS